MGGSRRARIAALIILTAIVAGLATVWYIRTDGPFQGTISVGDRPSTVAVDGRTGRAFIANGLSGGHGAVSVLDPQSGDLLRTIGVGDIAPAPAVDTQHGRVYIATQGLLSGVLHGDLTILDARDGQVSRRVGLPLGLLPEALAVDEATGHVFIATNADTQDGQGIALMLDGATGALLHAALVGRVIAGLALDARQGVVLVTGFDGDGSAGLVSELDAHTGRILHTFAVGPGPGDVAVDERAGRAMVVNRDGTMQMLDLRAGRVLTPARPLSASGDGATVVVSRRTGMAFVTLPPANAVEVRNAATGALVRRVRVGYNPVAARVDERAGLVLVADQGGNSLSILDARTGAPLRTVRAGPLPQFIAIDEASGQAIVIDAGTGAAGTAPSWWHHWLSWLPWAGRNPNGQGNVTVVLIR